jgi:8-oxo-dGTP diphosphatase
VPSKEKHIAVVASVIFQDDMVHCCKKGPHKYEYLSHRFEFPGGKIEPGENKEEALKREI